MLRTSFVIAAALTATVVSSPVCRRRRPRRTHRKVRVKLCADCQVQCDSCFKHCLELVATGKKEHAQTAQLCADCAECCKTCATLCARQSPLARHVLACCEKCCDECAVACEKFPDDEHMAACGKSCRDCAKESREMLKHLGK